ncbi:TMV resistance protein N-like [Pistacia vera]|uniref:TMV resistance protein N-like n=1 Tax=Pistacia vera TaxID=55513 RepID=UPI00126360C8|nr:TMV resistance protein N-like [Pistacia vera]
MSIQRASSHIFTSFSKWKYDVFLSFRGNDTQRNFTDHLYAALIKSGINVFKDDKELEKGNSISPELSKAIEESRISIIILSRNYASSTWCLNELLKIVHCTKTMKHKIIPIFYNVDPSVVRKQTENFEEAFAKHEGTFKGKADKIQKWRIVLTEVANLAGWALKDRHESEFIQDIVKDISRKLGPTASRTLEGLVGICSRLEKLRRALMGTKSDDVCMIGIYGMEGIGKTTIARDIYDLISSEFDGSSFLANVRETSRKRGVAHLQNQLLSQILGQMNINIWKVYDGIEMIRSSRIIITLRDKQLLITHGVDIMYKLLKFQAHFYLVTIDEWESALQRLGREYENGIFNNLQISFDGLKETQKKIFLDIVRFFKGGDKYHVTRILDRCSFNPTIGIAVLVNKSLITISDKNILWMHDLLQEMSQRIVKRDSPENPEKCSKLWKEADVHDVLTRNTDTEVIEGIILEKEVEYFTVGAKAFSNMSNLRLLRICKVQLPEGLEYLSNNLRLLEWFGYPLQTLPSILQLDKIVELKLPYSHISQLWKETKLKTFPQIIRSMESLVELCLDRTPIKELPFPVEHLKGIVLLSMEDCKNLVTLPTNINGLKSLKTLSISGCSKLENVPESLGQVENLERLDLSGTAVRRPTSSIFFMNNLKKLSFRGCKGQPSSPWYWPFPFNLMSGRRSDPIITLKLPSLLGLPSLTALDLSDCNLGAIPSEVGNLVSLQYLHLGKNNFVSLPSSINRLRKLTELYLDNCHRLQSLPELPPNLNRLVVDHCTSLERLPNALCITPYRLQRISCVNCLKLSDCKASVASTPKEMPHPSAFFTMIFIPGSEVPKWFSHQSEGSSIRKKCLPDMKLKGFFVTAVLFTRKHFPALNNNGFIRFQGNKGRKNHFSMDLYLKIV